MPQIINTNMMSLSAQRNLNQSQDAQTTAIQRLSSGLRINGAVDDAAGLAISERFTTQIRGLNQAARNAQDAVSLSQTADGALSSVSSNLQRMRELAVQSANGTNSQNERDALDLEFTQLRQEVNRIATQTAFAGVKLLDGTFSNVSFQIGASAGETLTISSLANANASSLGTYTGAATTAGTVTTMSAITAGHLSINGVSVGAVAAGTTVAGQAANVRTAINSVSAQTGVYAVAASSSSDATVTLRSLSAITVNAFGATALSTNTGLTAATTATSTQTGFASGGIFTAAAASEAMTAIDAALSTIGTARATMGSIQSRFEAVISNAQVTSENLTASRSRIQDADFAEETARLTRAQILQQAGTAMLAQANAVPQSVLALLRG